MPLPRDVNVQKEAGARVLIGLTQLTRSIVQINQVSDDSPLSGLVHPGDHIVGIEGGCVPSAAKTAETLVNASSLTLQVLTPLESDILFFHPGNLADVALIKDKETGLARVVSSRSTASPQVTAAQDLELGAAVLHPGDLVLAVGCSDGVLHLVDSPKAFQQRLRHARAGCLVEVRVVRDPHGEGAAAAAAPPVFKSAMPCMGSGCLAVDVPSPTRRTESRALADHPSRAIRRVGSRDAHSPTGTESGRSSPTSSLHEGSESDGARARESVEGAAWRARHEQLARKRSSTVVGRPGQESIVEAWHLTPREPGSVGI